MYECWNCGSEYDLIKLKDNGKLVGVITKDNGRYALFCFNEYEFNLPEEFLVDYYIDTRLYCDICNRAPDYRTKVGKELYRVVLEALHNRKNYRWF